MTTHDSKCDPKPFQALRDGAKAGELREETDRHFEVDDILHMREHLRANHVAVINNEPWQGAYPDGTYTGRTVDLVVTHIVRAPEYGLTGSMCMMSVQRVDKPDLLALATRYMEVQSGQGGMLVEVINRTNRRCFESDMAHVMPREPDVLCLVACAIMQAGFYGYTPERIAELWKEWDWKRLGGTCAICGQDHDREFGCPPQESKSAAPHPPEGGPEKP